MSLRLLQENTDDFSHQFSRSLTFHLAELFFIQYFYGLVVCIQFFINFRHGLLRVKPVRQLGQQFTRLDRFGNKVIHAGLHALEAIFCEHVCRHRNDRDR